MVGHRVLGISGRAWPATRAPPSCWSARRPRPLTTGCICRPASTGARRRPAPSPRRAGSPSTASAASLGDPRRRHRHRRAARSPPRPARSSATTRCVLATGSDAVRPAGARRRRRRCFVYRTIDDLDAIRAWAALPDGDRAAWCVGGGLLGLEAANALRLLGLETHVVEFAPRLMAVQLDDGGAQALRRKIEDLGIAVTHRRRRAPRSTRHRRRRRGLAFADGTELGADWSCSPPASDPRDELARAPDWTSASAAASWSTTRCAHRRSRRLRRSARCACHGGRMLRPGRPRLRDGRTWPRRHRRRHDAAFTGADLSTKLKLLGVDVASFGDAHATADGAEDSSVADPPAGLQEAGPRRRRAARSAASSSATPPPSAHCSCWPRALRSGASPIDDPVALPRPAPAAVAAWTATDLPDAATICSCNNVTKAHDLRGRPRRRTSDVAALKVVHQGRHRLRLVRAAGQGAARRRAHPGRARRSIKRLCEHFAMSRARAVRPRAGAPASGRSPSSSTATARPGLRDLQAGGGLDVRLARRRATSSTASRPRCRTPTTTSSPTSSATAPTRWCRGCPAARSRRSSSS